MGTPSRTVNRAYKEIRLQQLRSFCETARLGSLSAAAKALGLADPTVWEQVHALERSLSAKLIEPYGRGCRLTEEGRLLVGLAAPSVASIDALRQNFEAARSQVEIELTIAATPRILVDDLPACIAAFEVSHPNVRFKLVESGGPQVFAAVESGEADLGITMDLKPQSPSPWLVFEPGYQLDIVLVTPKEHPLARRRHVAPRDLRGFAVVNAHPRFPDPVIAAALDKLGVFRSQRSRVEAYYTAAIRRYVELGYGIGLVVALPSRTPSATLHERSMRQHFGRATAHLIRRKGTLQNGLVDRFAQIIKSQFNSSKRQRRSPPPAQR